MTQPGYQAVSTCTGGLFGNR